MENRNFSILILEDEPNLAFTLKLNLEEEGYSVTHAKSGQEAIELFQHSTVFDLILLDVMVPDRDGFEVLKEIRVIDPQVSVLMLTARAGDNERLKGLELGADDYITKPFHLQELILKIKRVYNKKSDKEKSADGPISVGDISLDTASRNLTSNQGRFLLTQTEVDIVKEFLSNPNKVLSRDYLLEKVWKLRGGITTRTVDNFIARIRKFLENNPREPKFIKSIRGKGYRLDIKDHH